MIELAVGVVLVLEGGPPTLAARHIAQQLVRSVTSAGANYEEARQAESRADFIHKVGVASKELGESLYWLGLLQRLYPHDQLPKLATEADELIAILVASRKTASARA